MVKFTGAFRDLIPDGWKFQKMFARNYRMYYKTCDGTDYGQKIRIWQHNGGYLEVGDLSSSLSTVLVKQIAENKIEDWSCRVSFLMGGTLEKVYWFIVDTENNLFHPYQSNEYNRIREMKWKISKEPQDKISKFFERYSEFHLEKGTISIIQSLLSKNYLKII